jgi:feruloyl esterase
LRQYDSSRPRFYLRAAFPMRRPRTAAIGILFLVALAAANRLHASPCEKLSALKIADTTIMLASSIPVGGLNLPVDALRPPDPMAAASRKALIGSLPAFCRVVAIIRPTPDSEIKFELWMPQSNWNERFLGVGNGAWAGSIIYSALANNLLRGFAVASTDGGHESGPFDASFAYGHPEKLIDFAYRAIHLMTVDAKVIVGAFYASPARYSYWNGCSTGGMQGLMEAQRFPDDYNGIVAGDPANFFTHLMFGNIWPEYSTLKDPESRISPGQFDLLYKSMINACDAIDGIADGIVSQPAKCSFDPGVLECKKGAATECLTPAQVEAVRKMLQGVVNPRTGQQVFPGLEPGTPLDEAAGGPNPGALTVSYFRNVLFKDADWDWRTLNFDTDVDLADRADAAILNATDPNLAPFRKRGGKLLLYHGWADPHISPMNSVNYYESVGSAVGGADKIQDFLRLFMIPGMRHCGRGPGPDDFDEFTVIEQWVEKGNPPDAILATHSTDGKVDMSRPLCPYPKVAIWKGSGSTSDAVNFSCELEK